MDKPKIAGKKEAIKVAPEAKIKKKKVKRNLSGFILPLLLLLLWEIIAANHWVKPYFLPAPLTVVHTFYRMVLFQNFWTDFQTSILTVIQGFIAGAVLGLLFGIGSGLSKKFEVFFGGTLNGIRQVPPMAWLPLIILWIGVGNTAKVVIIAKAVFFPVFLNTLQGIRSVPKEYIEVAKVFEYTRLQLLRFVVLPSALPSIFVGLRYGAGLSWAMIVAAEMVSGLQGLGFLLLRAQELLITDELFVVMVVIGVVGFGIDLVIRSIEKRVLRWKKAYEG